MIENNQNGLADVDFEICKVLARKGYSDAALAITQRELRNALYECCYIVNERTHGAAQRAHASFHEGLLTDDRKDIGNTIDTLNIYLMQIFQEWARCGYSSRDLDLI